MIELRQREKWVFIKMSKIKHCLEGKKKKKKANILPYPLKDK
jgi:hypothetical protein